MLQVQHTTFICVAQSVAFQRNLWFELFTTQITKVASFAVVSVHVSLQIASAAACVVTHGAGIRLQTYTWRHFLKTNSTMTFLQLEWISRVISIQRKSLILQKHPSTRIFHSLGKKNSSICMGVLLGFVYFPHFMRYLTNKPLSFLNMFSVFTI